MLRAKSRGMLNVSHEELCAVVGHVPGDDLHLLGLVKPVTQRPDSEWVQQILS